jgi:hypothetical protein
MNVDIIRLLSLFTPLAIPVGKVLMLPRQFRLNVDIIRLLSLFTQLAIPVGKVLMLPRQFRLS